MLKRIGVVLALVFATMVVASPAHASFNCNTGMLCLYNDANYSGTVTAYTNPTGCHSLSGLAADNNVSSIHNFTSHAIVMDIGYSCSNLFQFTVNAGQSFSNLAGSGWNDGISSFKVLTSAPSARSGNMELAAYVRIGEIRPCIHGDFCMYTDSNYSGLQLTWFWPTGCWNTTGTFNNSISSFHNYTESVATIFDAPGCPPITPRIPHYSFAPPADIKNLNALPYWPFWNDVVSSVLFS